MDRFIQFAYAATLESLADSGLDLDSVDRTGRASSSLRIGGLKFIEEQEGVIRNQGPKKVSPFLVPMTPSTWLRADFHLPGAAGSQFRVSSACATGTNAIGLAYDYIRTGQADIMFSGGTRPRSSPCVLPASAPRGPCPCETMIPRPHRRPFDRDRDGLWSARVARSCSWRSTGMRAAWAKIYAEVLGFSATGDGYHLTAPHPEGHGAPAGHDQRHCHAGIEKEAITFINAHGPPPVGDIAECRRSGPSSAIMRTS
jgi:3-oxoacyl-[acyl-carrier-protein] synthase II